MKQIWVRTERQNIQQRHDNVDPNASAPPPRDGGKERQQKSNNALPVYQNKSIKKHLQTGGKSADCPALLKFHANALFPLSGDAASSTQTRVGIKTRVCVNVCPGPACSGGFTSPLLPPVPQQGQVDCWPLPCPPVDCEFTVVPEGECCPRCITDPCQADTIRNDITKTCTDEHGISRFSGSSWIKHGTECTLCQCKVSVQ